MNVSLLNFDPQSASGPNSFGSRLASEMTKNGHTVSLEPSQQNLIFIQHNEYLPHYSKNILRLDGIWTKKEQIQQRSVILYGYEMSDSVIWQSEYDKFVTTNLWGYPRDGIVIPNGISHEQVVVSKEVYEFRQRFDKLFVCSANWHNQKRLTKNIEFFHKNKGLNDALVILGNNCFLPYNSHDIFTVGSLPHNMCLQLYKVADWMIHLAWRDHCPNVVLEALSQGCPVICSSSGGTKEIVMTNGIVLDDNNDNDIDQLEFDYDSPPDIKIEKIDLKKIVVNKDIVPSIEQTYQSYNKIFEQYFK